MHSKVLILDFGSQFTQVIARRVREADVYSEVLPCNTDYSAALAASYQAIILSGGPASVDDPDAPPFDSQWLESGLPILGICYGLQLICHLSGAKLVRGATSREYGLATIEIKSNKTLFKGFGVEEKSIVWMSHGDQVIETPAGYELLAASDGAPCAAIGHKSKPIFAVQFHPEVFHTPRGREIINNFLFTISKLTPSWKLERSVEPRVEQIARQVPVGANVIAGLSGGVDSLVAAVLVGRAIGARLHCIFVDNGLLRRNEVEEVLEAIRHSGLKMELRQVDARAEFLGALRGVTDPEQKRKIIGKIFIDVFDAEAEKISNVTHLVQGTLYPDVIESVSVRGPSATIKTHHNVGGLPLNMRLKLIEPLRDLFKDEVRRLGENLGLPHALLWRHPFPGPGLAVRILGEITEERLEKLRLADRIFIEEIKAHGVYDNIWQAFAVLLPVRSVGVMGDGRTYAETIALRAVSSEDGMTADWVSLPDGLLRRVSSRIVNEVKGVNRVVLDISSKPPATIEWE